MSVPLHFLVVDDLSVVRQVVIALLKKLGHTTVTEASDGKQALELLQFDETAGTPINVILTDWNMPVMDGLALVKSIRASTGLRHLPVLMITSEAQADSSAAAAQAGVDGFIVKSSLDARLLRETLDEILTRRGLTA